MNNLKKRKSDGYWTFERCKEVALQFQIKGDFIKNEANAYQSAWRNGWLDKICKHMIVLKSNFTIEECKEEALKYSSRVEFQKQSNKYYSKAHRAGWLDIVCYHMIPIGHIYNRMVYSFEFPDKSVYVGLTYNNKLRYDEHITNKHRNNSAVYNYMIETNLEPQYKILSNYVNVFISQKLEAEFLEQYENNGWKILNRTKTGSIGGVIIKWTKEKCKEEALEYKTRTEFIKNAGSAYNSALRNGWLTEITQHMELQQLPNGYWSDNKERCHQEALKYKTKKDFMRNNAGAYSAASKNGWISEICSHMEELKKSNSYWSFEKCNEAALKCETRTEFQNKFNSAYNKAHKNGWLDEICFHMKKGSKWNNKENCTIEALKYTKRIFFIKGSKTAYETARKNKWLDEICSHMEPRKLNLK